MPIWGDDGNLSQIMFVVEDRTEAEGLRREVNAERDLGRRNLQMLEELAEIELPAMESFLSSATRTLSELRIEVARGPIGPDVVWGVARGLQSLRGNASVFGLSLLAVTLHQAEMVLGGRIAPLRPPLTDELKLRIDVCRTCLGQYAALAKRVFGAEDEFRAATLGQLRERLLDLDRARGRAPDVAARAAHSLKALGRVVEASGLVEAVHRYEAEGGRAYAEMVRRCTRTLDEAELLYGAPWTAEELEASATVVLGLVDDPPGQGLAAAAHHGSALFQANRRPHLDAAFRALERASIDDSIESNVASALLRQVLWFLQLVAWSVDPEGTAAERLHLALGEASLVGRFPPVRSGPFLGVRQVLVQFLEVSTTCAALVELSDDADAIAVSAYLRASGDLTDLPLSPVARTIDVVTALSAQPSLAVARRFRVPSLTPVVAEHLPAIAALVEQVQQGCRPLDDLGSIVSMLEAVPVGHVFGRLVPVAQDLAVSLKKQVNLDLIGAEQLLPRQTLSALYDALLHVVRNAIDHGIQRPGERTAAGKTATGRITISVRHEGDEVEVRVADDGQGVDVDSVRARIVAAGWLTAEAAHELSDEAVHAYVLQPGLSTARKVTQLSGRGVGMDVVSATAHRLRGSVRVASQLGKGTEVCIRFRHDTIPPC